MPISFKCPVCAGPESYHPEDVAQGYCGHCHAFTGACASMIGGRCDATPVKVYGNIAFCQGHADELDAAVAGREANRRFEFSVWPTETGTWEPSVFELWRAGNLHGRIEMEMTEAEWSAFSSSLERQGLTIRELEVHAISVRIR